MKNTIIASITIWFILLFPLHSSANGSVPYQTETISAEGDVIETQTAYIPLGLFGANSDLANPEDIYIDKQSNVYIVDSQTKKVIVIDESGKVITEVGEGILEFPTGVFVDDEGAVFVADYQKEKILRFSIDGKLEKEFGRPDSPLFGKNSPFLPQKVAVDKRGNIYIIGEGSTNGIIQLSHEGSFLGYYGVNNTQNSISSFFKNLITSEEQKSRLFLKTPPAPDNIAIDSRGLIYSITEGTTSEVIKKLNVAGANLLPTNISNVSSYKDISIDQNENIYVLDQHGTITEFDSYGNLLFRFGGKDDGTNRLGLFKQPTGIAIDQKGTLYVTDKERGSILHFQTTAFGQKVNEGIALYKEGLYVKSQTYWEEVLKLNTSFGLAHSAMGRAHYKQQDYEQALKEFQLAEDRMGYSAAFWEIRQVWMQRHLSKVFIILLILWMFKIVLQYLDKKNNLLETPRNTFKKVKEIKLISELLFMLKFFRHPIDSFYYLKRKEYASVLSASILYVVLLIEYLISKYFTSFLFRASVSESSTIFVEVITVFSPVVLFIVANYLVSTITDGEGRLKHIYIGTIYSLVPYLVFILPLTAISNVLTYNEAFIYVFSIRIIYAWCLLILFIMIKEVHNFSFSETVRNILVTLFGMVILILVLFVIYVLLDQVYDFINSIIQEVMLRV